ncbi:hypothetical protein [Burkholderia stabilis]|uniref:hypothetical protein n=1 Tax=Burkholderia stabilis TaxID=95485 RepID=UPI001590D05B|nr:hypothetical protein [Burkholderia stabilis]
MKLVEVSQDGAGVLATASAYADGFFAAGISSACVLVFFGTERYSLVHDTGQLALPEIASIARRCGVIVEAFSAINPLLVSREADDLHDDRRGRLRNLLRLKRGMTKLVIPDGNLACLNDRTMLARNELIVAGNPVFIRPPGGDVRKQINILNNLFAEKDSQSLPVDLQFELDHYTDTPMLHKSETEMQAIAEAKLSQGASDHNQMLMAARAIFAMRPHKFTSVASLDLAN